MRPQRLDEIEDHAPLALEQGDLAGAQTVLRDAIQTGAAPTLVAYFANQYDLGWVLDSAQERVLFALTPDASDGDRGVWAIVRAQQYAVRGDELHKRMWADTASGAMDVLEPLMKEPYFLNPAWLTVDPGFAPLRGNARFTRVAASVGRLCHRVRVCCLVPVTGGQRDAVAATRPLWAASMHDSSNHLIMPEFAPGSARRQATGTSPRCPASKRWASIASAVTAAALIVGVAGFSRGPERARTDSTEGVAATSRDSLFSGYSPVSPHWPHIRTMMTDFYYKWMPAERAWAGRHYDYSMSGSVSAWKTANPSVQHYKYVLLQATIIPKPNAKGDIQSGWYRDMIRWYAGHPQYRVESAFLHQAGQPPDSAHRLRPWGWDSFTWIINPADSGIVAYSEDRFRRAVEGEDGLFVDAQGSGDMAKNIKGAAEYPADSKWPPQRGAYNLAYSKLLARLRSALGTKTLMINSGPYRFAPDSADVLAAGATHMEKTNNPMSTDLPATWAWIDNLLSLDAFVDFVNAHDYADMGGSVKKGYDTSIEGAYHRMKLAELASYYMVVPRSPDHVALQLVSMWDRPYPPLWLAAQEANIGHPAETRHLVTQGIPATDPAGQQVRVFERGFDRALVLFRAQTGWGAQIYGDTTAVTVRLPNGERWLPLFADGTLGSPVTRVALCNANAVILIKGRTLQ